MRTEAGPSPLQTESALAPRMTDEPRALGVRSSAASRQRVIIPPASLHARPGVLCHPSPADSPTSSPDATELLIGALSRGSLTSPTQMRCDVTTLWVRVEANACAVLEVQMSRSAWLGV
ncbi:hypothetical protein NDU88_001303 [Pleurodeles waltl]|uniref:Uncharacterized protein n=1 Tax=Pleurodeles waltl TaxID=8319 RepID=A0AAV7RC75_PLEWA|nr:hypothetical protein NDU88_001303 [Pleurodeles waltl]